MPTLENEVCWRCYRKDRTKCKEQPEEKQKCSRVVYAPRPIVKRFISDCDADASNRFNNRL